MRLVFAPPAPSPLSLPFLASAAALIFSAAQPVLAQNALLQPQQAAPKMSDRVWLAPFRYIPNPNQQEAERPVKKRPAEQQQIVDAYQDGRYGDAASQGLALMSQGPIDDDLRILVANSLAWTGSLDKAKQVYQGVTDPTLLGDANLGIANILHWQGKDELAAPIYRQVVRDFPENTDAVQGLKTAERGMAPTTTVSFGGIQDSNNLYRQVAALNHRWASADGLNRFEVEAAAAHDTFPGIDSAETDYTLRYQALGLPLKPAFEMSVPNNSSGAYGGVKLWLVDDHLRVDVGRVNWGLTSSSATALSQALRATHIGLLGRGDTSYGTLTGQAHWYNISDGNTMWSTDVRLTSNAQPLGQYLKPYFGLETRQAANTTPAYWSPATGYGLAYAGLQYAQDIDAWSLDASTQFGVPVYGEAGVSWGASGNAKRWLTDNLALGLNLWAMSSWRSGAPYSAQSYNVFLEKVWR